LTPLKYLSIIVCDIGNIPPHSVPVVIREIVTDYEDEDRLQQIEFEESSSESNEEGEDDFDLGSDEDDDSKITEQ